VLKHSVLQKLRPFRCLRRGIPRGAHGLAAAIGLGEPSIPFARHRAAKRLRQPGQRVGDLKHGVLVVQLDDSHSRVFRIREPGIGIDVADQVARVLLLRRDVRLIDEVDALAETVHLFRLAGIGTADMQVDVHVDAVLLELSDQPVELVELLRVQRLHVVVEDALRRLGEIEVMQPDEVEAEFSEPTRHARRLLLGRHGMVVADVRAEQPHFAAAAVHDPLAVRPQMPVRPSRLRVEKREVNRRAGSVSIRQVRNDERKPPLSPVVRSRTRSGRCQPD